MPLLALSFVYCEECRLTFRNETRSQIGFFLLSMNFQLSRYRATSKTLSSCRRSSTTRISWAVPYPRSYASLDTSQVLTSVDFQRVPQDPLRHEQYKMYSSEQPWTAGMRYEPFPYGLNAIRYLVEHSGHSTQWRRRGIQIISNLGKWRECYFVIQNGRTQYPLDDSSA